MSDWIKETQRELEATKAKKARMEEEKKQKALRKRMTQLKKQQDTKINYCKKQIASLKKESS